MTRIEHHDGRACPYLYCDECGHKIRGIGLAMAAWTLDNPRVYHVHKGRCLDRLERRVSPESWLLTEELITHLYYLVSNHGMTMPAPAFMQECC
jgi:hypothetical protein